MAKKPKIGCIVSSLALCAFVAVVFYVFLSHHNVENKLGYFKGGLLSSFCFLIFLTSADFTWRITSDFYSFTNLWIHYISLILLRVLSSIFYKKLLRDTHHIKLAQEETLMQYIKANRFTDYGVTHKFAGIKSVDQFRASHPLTRYDHYREYIQRVHDGDVNVMSRKRPYVLAMTSGTSGEPKMLPMQTKQRGTFFFYGILPLFHVLFTEMEGIKNLQKKLKFFYTPRWRKSPAGIDIGPNSSSPTNSKSELSFHSTPAAAFEIMSEPEALYVYLLFGLRDKKLGYLEANFASMIYTAFVSMEKNWRSIVEDIKLGRVSPDLHLERSIEDRLNAELSPDRERALELETEFERGFLGVAKKIWPHMNFILCVDSGAFQVYGELLKNGYCKGIEIYSPIYAATEGIVGLNLWPHNQEKHYMLLPRALFYEFIPIEDSHSDNPDTVLLHQVEKDKVYEMVISNSSGLYRYRFGDVVRIAGYYNQAPKVEFMYRQGQLLNVRGEKTSEKLFFDAFQMANQEVFGESQLVVDYCCAEQLATTADTVPRYQLFIELSGSLPSRTQVKLLEEKLDDNLKQSYIYKSFRLKGSIAAPSVYIVEPGTFSRLRIMYIENEKATPNQFKIPRVLKKKDAMDFMSACTANIPEE